MTETSRGVPSEFRGYDEGLALEYATAAVIGAEPEDIALDFEDPDGLWRLRRIAHGVVRDAGSERGLSLYERLALQGGVRNLVSDQRFVAHILEQGQETDV